jgi:hypothetical protein
LLLGPPRRNTDSERSRARGCEVPETSLQHNDKPLINALPLWGLTLVIAALPILSYLLFRNRAKTAMPKVRDWMFANSWLVNIIVIGIFIVLILG